LKLFELSIYENLDHDSTEQAI